MNQPACTPITLFSTWFQVVTQSFVTNAGKGWQTFTTHSTTTTTQTLCTISDAGTCGGFLTTTITSDVYGSSTFGPITISGTTTYESAVSTPTSTITCPATTDAAPSNTEDAVSDTASSVGPSVATVKPKQEQSTTGAVIAPAVAGGIVACILLALLLFFTRRTWSRKRSVTSSSETTFFDQSLRGPMDKAPSEWTPSSGSPDEWLPIAQSPWISRRLSLQTSIDSVMAQHASVHVHQSSNPPLFSTSSTRPLSSDTRLPAYRSLIPGFASGCSPLDDSKSLGACSQPLSESSASQIRSVIPLSDFSLSLTQPSRPHPCLQPL